MYMRKIPKEIENPIDNAILDFVDDTNPIYKTINFTPNILTTLSLMMTIIALHLYIKGYHLFAAIFYLIGYYYDCADGHFARTYNMTTTFGDYYDHISDFAKGFLILLIFHSYANNFPIYFIVFLTFFILTAMHIGCQEKIYNNNEHTILDVSKYLCSDEKNIRYTRYFGAGTFNVVIALMLLIPK